MATSRSCSPAGRAETMPRSTRSCRWCTPSSAKIADAYLRRERSSHTLQPTALVNEAWLRLVRQDELQFDHRKQFYALAAKMMRRILVDHARALAADKRGGGASRTTLDAELSAGANRTIELLALDEALEQLARVSPRQAQVIELDISEA